MSYDQKLVNHIYRGVTGHIPMPRENRAAQFSPFAALTEYGESAVGYTLRLWVKSPDYWDVFFQVNQRIGQVFAENNIEMTYPHVNVHLEK